MIKPLLGAVAVAAVVLAAGTQMPSVANAKFDDAQKAEIESIVKQYLLGHPEVLLEMSQALETKQNADQEEQITKAIQGNREALYRSPRAPIAGNPQGDVTVIEFFDYNCGYCRRALPDLVKLIKTDPKIRVVLKELPIFGGDSEQAARIALASIKQGKYFEMHQRLLGDPGHANEEKALSVAKELGLDMRKLKADAKDPSIQEALDENKKLADQIGLQGTPLYLVGDRVIPGAPDNLDEILEKTAQDIRKSGCKIAC